MLMTSLGTCRPGNWHWGAEGRTGMGSVLNIWLLHAAQALVSGTIWALHAYACAQHTMQRGGFAAPGDRTMSRLGMVHVPTR